VELEKVPVPPVEKVTVPLGALAVPESLSLTVAVQVVFAFRATGEGVHATTVEVVR
jgi:hypothetical protein